MEFVVEYRQHTSGPSFKIGKVKVEAANHKEAFLRGANKVPKGAVILSTMSKESYNDPTKVA